METLPRATDQRGGWTVSHTVTQRPKPCSYYIAKSQSPRLTSTSTQSYVFLALHARCITNLVSSAPLINSPLAGRPHRGTPRISLYWALSLPRLQHRPSYAVRRNTRTLEARSAHAGYRVLLRAGRATTCTWALSRTENLDTLANVVWACI